MRVLMLAQGTGRRWDTKRGPYLDVPKHLVQWAPGETLLERAVRLFLERGHQVIVIGPDDRYRVPGAELVTLDDPDPSGCDMSKFTGTRHLWATDDRTIIAWGDVFYTEAVVDAICSHTSDRYHVFRRPGPSKVTGHQWDESFAVTFGPEDHRRILDVADQVIAMFTEGRLRRTPIRCHLAAWDGLEPRLIDSKSAVWGTPSQTHLDDFTDDIDSPTDYANWSGRFWAGRIELAVVIPWMGGDRHRKAARRHVRSHYEGLGVEVIEGADDTGGSWNNRARACNNAVAVAIEGGAEAILIGDADTLVGPVQLWAAAHTARWTGRLTLAFDNYVKVSEPGTRRVLKRGRTPRPREGVRGHVSGAVMVTPSIWDQLGGFDERFTAWGGEDRALWMTAAVLLGRPPRIEGAAWHLYHPPSPETHRDHPARAAVRAHGQRYMAVTGFSRRQGAALGDLDLEQQHGAPSRDALLDLLTEPGGPLYKKG